MVRIQSFITAMITVVSLWTVASADDDIRIHHLDSSRQSGPTSVTVLLPTVPAVESDYRVLYVLPVESGSGTRWGDQLAEVRKQRLHDVHGLICVFPTFADLPWYADHPVNQQIQQEAYFLNDVIPLIEARYPVLKSRSGRMLLGFSKSGWGAWSLLLRHPETFERAAAFDSPMMMSAPGKYGSGPVFGTVENFERYRISARLEHLAPKLRKQPERLFLLGSGNFASEHTAVAKHLKTLKIPFGEVRGVSREHSWHSGWVAEAVRLLCE